MKICSIKAIHLWTIGQIWVLLCACSLRWWSNT